MKRIIAITILLIGFHAGSVNAKTISCGIYATTQKCFTASTLGGLHNIITAALNGDPDTAIEMLSNGQAAIIQEGSALEVVVGVRDTDKKGVSFCYNPQNEKYVWIQTGHLVLFDEHKDIDGQRERCGFYGNESSKCRIKQMKKIMNSDKIPQTIKTVNKYIVVAENSEDFTMAFHLCKMSDKDAIVMGISEEAIKVLQPGTKLSVLKQVKTTLTDTNNKPVDAIHCYSEDKWVWVSSEYVEPIGLK